MNSRIKDITNNRYGRLVVIKLDSIKNRKSYWLCKCDCGTEKVIYSCDFKSGRTRSCGCLNREKTIERNKQKHSKERRRKESESRMGKDNPNYKHGNSRTPAYFNMMAQQYNAMKLNQTPTLTENEKKKIELYYTISHHLGENFHVDHIHPLSKGGLHHPDNLQILTKEENLIKSNKLNTNIKGFRI